MSQIFRLGSYVSAVLMVAALSACGDGGVQEIKSWMDQVRASTKVTIPKLAPPKIFTPFNYAGKGSIDPYNPAKLSVALAKLQSNSAGLKPDLDRRREPLENYPLDALKMVGTLKKASLSYALIEVDKTIYQVKVGDYIGQNFGRVASISETAIGLDERVQDASGEWVVRKTQLELQETKK